jgi:subtilisin-like proprotein convertase family protein
MTPLPSVRRGLACAIASGALLASTLSVSSTSAQAAPSPTSSSGPEGAGADSGAFQATTSTVGAIPDGPDTGGTCSTTTPGVKEVQIPVSGVNGPITSVRVNMAIEHDKLGDLGFQLVAPNGTTVAFIDRIGAAARACGDDTGINGNFSFQDGESGNLLALASSLDATRDITGGSYFPSTAAGSPVPLAAPFAAAGDGVWKLRILDYQAGVVGRVYSASVGLRWIDRAKECRRATVDVKNTTFSKKRATKQLRDLQAKLKRVKRSGAKKSVLAEVRRKVARKKATVKSESDRLTVAKAAQAASCG